LTLYTTPVVYILFDRLRLWLTRLWTGRKQSGTLPNETAEAS